MAKDVLYLDVEDDITAVIGKLKKSKGKVVALVPPKRTTVLSSVVNLKLLKKAATDSKKKLVLVTADDTLMNLAGGLKIHVAKNLTTAPEIPDVASVPELPSEHIEETDTVDESAKAATPKKADTSKAKNTVTEKLKKLKPIRKEQSSLPDFNSFRKKLFIIVGGLAVLIFGWWWIAVNVPSAQVKLKGQTNRITSEFPATFSFEATEASTEERIVPAARESVESTQKVEAEATGEENRGEKATGTLTIENCLQSEPLTLVAGTKFRASGGEIFLSTETVTVPGGSFFLGSCSTPGDASVGARAETGGDDKNIAATTYDIVNFSSAENSAVAVNGSAMGGGTDDIVKIVTQDDIDAAIEKLTEEDLEAITTEIAAKFTGEAILIDKTLKTKNSKDTISPKVGEAGDKVVVERTATYSMVGVDKALYEQFLKAIHQEQLGDQQVVVESGIEDVIYTITQDGSTGIKAELKVQGRAGPDIDIPSLSEQLKGRGYTEAIGIAEDIPGILKAEIELSPFWVSKMPSKASNITIEVDVSGLTSQEDESSGDAQAEEVQE